jgi:xylulokinase
VNLGTAVVAGVFADRYHYHPSFRTLYGAVPGTYLCESDLKGGSFTLTWLVDKVLRADRSDARPVEEMLADLEIAARSLPSGSEGVVLVPYWNGVMNPYWDDDATGMLIGLTGNHRTAHLYRAALEGIAFEQRLALDGIAAATAPIEELVVLGGGAKSELWCQILADVTGRTVVRAATYEATALGAGMMAAAATGMHADSHAAVRAMTHTAERFEPGPARHHYAQLFGVYCDLYPALRQPLGRLAAIRRGRAGR